MMDLKRLWAVLVLLALSACGGGGGSAGTPLLGSTPSPTVSDIVVVLSSPTISNTGTTTVKATVTAVDGSRNGVPNAAMALTVDNNAVVTAGGTKTDTNGAVTATISIGSDHSNRDITITAQSGSVSRSTVLKVVTDPNTANPTADDLSLSLSAPSITNGGSSTIIATATAVDRNRNVVPGIPVTFAVDSNAIASVSGTSTAETGTVTATVSIGADRTNRVITVTATSGSITRSASFAVTGARLSVSASPLVIAGTAGNVIEYTLVDFNALPMVNQTITVSGTGLTSASGKTDLNGKFRYTYTAPASASTLEIVAVAAGDQRTQSVTVSSLGTGVAPASEVPQSASLAPTPSVVTVNTVGSNANQVELRALFLGSNNKPIPRVRVRFDLAGNLTSSDGQVSWVGNYAYSDENGVARATFTPGQRSSPTNGITLRACYDINDFASGPASACDGVARATTTTLTVSSEALAVSIRTNELIKSGEALLTYIKEYVVMVVDSAGQAKSDVQITPSVDLTGYYKGHYVWNGLRWVQVMTLDPNSEYYRWTGSAWTRTAAPIPDQPSCPNEDVNRNGVREAGVFVPTAAAPELAARQEDLNWNGELDPRKSDVAVKMVGSTKTDANGLAILQIEYGRDLASWVDYVITVTASGVSGTEVRAKYIGNLYGLGNLPYPASAVSDINISPPFIISPYGRGTVCTDTN